MAVRKQEIEDRLNSWIMFNEKNKELCAWLVQMENKVLQTADVSIEEMIEKLQKVSGGGVPQGMPGGGPWLPQGCRTYSVTQASTGSVQVSRDYFWFF